MRKKKGYDFRGGGGKKTGQVPVGTGQDKAESSERSRGNASDGGRGSTQMQRKADEREKASLLT